MASTDGIKHTTFKINGINMRVAEKGEGPVVLFVHGFPELWYSWRHQILALSALGYRAVAPDMRGYGDTDAPSGASSYTYFHMVGDLVALIDALDEDKVFVVGHDWGALVAWQLCLFRSDKVKALVSLSTPFLLRMPTCSVSEALKSAYGDDHYICRFQAPGEIEAEVAENGGAERFLATCFKSFSSGGQPLMLAKGEWFKSIPPQHPTWITEEEFAYYIKKFEETGFTGGLNYYRAFNMDWELTAPWMGAKVKVPVKLIMGEFDNTYNTPGVREYIHKGGMQEYVPLLGEVVVLEGVGHFLQQEKPNEISKHIYDFIHKL